MDDVLRRRSVGAPAARSTLLTILGEFLLPRPDGAWQEALIGSLKLLGFTPSAARQAVVRSARENWLACERVGRRSRMRLTASSAELLRDGARRIYGFGGPVTWDGRWLLLVLRVPEPRRELRHRLTTQLAWAGFGSLGGGLWITPHVDREALISAEEPAQLLSFRAELGALGGNEKVIGEAWDLPALREHYEQFVADFVRLRPRGGASTFAAQTALVHAWRRFPFIDPDLPDDLLPRDWPRRRALRAVHGPPRAVGAGRAGALRVAVTPRKRIYVAYVGGTIGMKATDSGYAPVSGHLTAQVRDRPELRAPEVPELSISEYEPLLDSANARPADWLRIARDIAEHRHHYDGFVVAARHRHDGLHGLRARVPAARARQAGGGHRLADPARRAAQRRAPELADRGAGRRARRRPRGLPRVRLEDPARRSRGQVQRERLRGLRVAEPARRSALAGVEIEVDDSRLRSPEPDAIALPLALDAPVGLLRLYPGMPAALLRRRDGGADARTRARGLRGRHRPGRRSRAARRARRRGGARRRRHRRQPVRGRPRRPERLRDERAADRGGRGRRARHDDRGGLHEARRAAVRGPRPGRRCAR